MGKMQLPVLTDRSEPVCTGSQDLTGNLLLQAITQALGKELEIA